MHARARPNRRLIVTADDFGLCEPVNDAVERGHREGILSTASLMVAAPASADAVRRAHALTTLRVGLHLVLVNGRPALSAARLPALVDSEGALPTGLAAAGVRFFFHPRARTQLEAEIRAQFAAFAKTGLVLDHVNAQNHMHVHPTIFGILLRVARDYGSPPVRIPREPFFPSWRSSRTRLGARLANATLLSPWLALMRARLERNGIAHNDYVFGMNDTGEMTPARVRAVLANLPPGVSEIYFHPATERWAEVPAGMERYAFADEFAALIDRDVARTLAESGIEATAYGMLTKPAVA
jgi:hopanoid biosynthesis associated protein HpnK